MNTVKMITSFIIILILMYSYTNVQSSSFSHNHIPLSSMEVQGAVNIEAHVLKKENALISVNFTLGADTNGIFPIQEDVNIVFMTSGKLGVGEPCIVIHIPANSFEKIERSYEMYNNTNPADTGIKVLVVDEYTGEILKDLSETLSYIHSIISPGNGKGQYFLVIDAIFGHENRDLKSLALITSSIKSALTIGDDSGSALARNIEFRTP